MSKQGVTGSKETRNMASQWSAYKSGGKEIFCQPIADLIYGRDLEGRGRGLIEIGSKHLDGGTSKTAINLSRDSRRPHRNSNRAPPNYKLLLNQPVK
jgi:hypothetical protein